MLVKTVDIRQITEAECAETKKFFTDTAEKVKSFLPEDRKRTLAGRYLLKKMIKEIYGREGFELSYNENGKPELDFCFFSISHKPSRRKASSSTTNIFSFIFSPADFIIA